MHSFPVECLVTKEQFMLRQLTIKNLMFAVGFLIMSLFSTVSFANEGHEHMQKSDAVELSTNQPKKWKEAPFIPLTAEKEISRYAIQQQLEKKATNDNSSQTLFYILITLIVITLLIVLTTAANLLSKLKELSGDTKSFNWNNLNSSLMLAFMIVFFGGIAYEVIIHSKFLLPVSASEHGVKIDTMFNVTLALTGFVFIVTHILLFWFSYKYKHSSKRKALYYPENDKLEIAWTVIPAVTLTILVLFGFQTWNNTMIFAPDDAEYEVELYAYQFGWKFRYPGPDGKLGKHDFRFINSDSEKGPINELGLDLNDPASKDDIIVGSELVLPKGKIVTIRLRSQDVLHSALLPHFRAQMYCVPGTPTQFTLKPTISTKEMKAETNNPEFNYELACNQICGASHYNMKRDVIVLEEDGFEKWLSEQKVYFADLKEKDNNNKNLTLK